MKHKQVVLRALADRDIRQAIDYYLGEGAQQAALNFVDAPDEVAEDVTVVYWGY